MTPEERRETVAWQRARVAWLREQARRTWRWSIATSDGQSISGESRDAAPEDAQAQVVAAMAPGVRRDGDYGVTAALSNGTDRFVAVRRSGGRVTWTPIEEAA